MVEAPVFDGQRNAPRGDNHHYAASNPARLRRLIRRSGIDPSQYHFVDLGSGKGRPLIIASRYPFQSIMGIEADAGLCAIARANVAAWLTTHHHCPPIGIIEADARIAALPDGNLFLFMFNPFSGAVLEAVAKRLAQLARQPSRHVVIAYSGDEHCAVLERTGALRRERVKPLRPWLKSTVSLFFNAAADPKKA